MSKIKVNIFEGSINISKKLGKNRIFQLYANGITDIRGGITLIHINIDWNKVRKGFSIIVLNAGLNVYIEKYRFAHE